MDWATSGVSPGSHSSSRVVACTCAFLPSSSSSVTLLFAWVKGSVPFPRGFPKELSHVPPWCVSMSILGLKVEAVQGNQVSLEWTETSWGFWEWWHDPGVPLAFPVESASSSDATGMPGILCPTRNERIPHLELGGGNGALLDVGGILVLPFEWRRVCRETS